MKELCRICGSDKTEEIIAKEMMIGTRESFIYVECNSCNVVVIKEVPTNISEYYPNNYYSFNSNNANKQNRILSTIRKKSFLFGLNNIFFVGKFLQRFFTVPPYYHWFSKINLSRESKILDVGCGDGKTLFRMEKDGFTNLTGIDRFLSKEIKNNKNVKVMKKDIFDIEGRFDLIMLNHVFEHMENPSEVLEKIYSLLKPNRYALIRIPTVSSFAYKHYGTNWVQFDAPRHFFLHSIQSMELLSKKTGFVLKDSFCDSTEFQFWGSEQYLKNIPLHDKSSYSINLQKSMFSEEQIMEFSKRAEKLNKEKNGDQRCFFLYKNN